MKQTDISLNYDEINNQWNLEDTTSYGLIDQVFNLNNDEWEIEEIHRKNKFAKAKQYKITPNTKLLFRDGIPCSLRRKWWFIASNGINLFAEAGSPYDSVLKRSQSYPHNESFFGDELRILSVLPEKVAEQCQSFLHSVWTQNAHIEFSPLIPTVAVILLLYMEPPLAYLTLQAMINRSKDDGWYFTLTKDHFLASIETFRSLVGKHCKPIVSKCAELKIDIAQIGLALFPVFFLPFTPLPVALTIFDSFVYEGRKVLVRVALALFIRETKNLLKTKTPQEFYKAVQDGMATLIDVKSTHSLLHEAFSLNLSRYRHIKKEEDSVMRNRMGIMSNPQIRSSATCSIMICPEIRTSFLNLRRNSVTSISDDSESSGNEVNISLAEFKPSESQLQEQIMLHSKLAKSAAPIVKGGKLCTPELLFNLRPFLPHHLRSHQLKKVFSISEQGTLFLSMFNEMMSRESSIFVIKTNYNTFGAFITDPLNPKMSGKGRYYGQPSTFVFQCSPFAVYKTKGINQNFESVTKTDVFIGGPKAAIYFRDGFKSVISEECETFGNPSFTRDADGDEIIDFEIYTFIVPRIN